mmetsp:Transcript_11232/g.38325  ORF Transcript_11232/g.38325 Transcript_11232/m.38325 type:complete len:99 (-) Transcript_11232:582-878(-)
MSQPETRRSQGGREGGRAGGSRTSHVSYQPEICHLDHFVVWTLWVATGVEEVLGLQVSVYNSDLMQVAAKEGGGDGRKRREAVMTCDKRITRDLTRWL